MLADREMISFLATIQPEASIRFYRDILGFTVIEDQAYALVFKNAAGQMLRVSKPRAHMPAPHTVLGWRVADIAAEVAALAARGVTFLSYGFLQQDDGGIWTAPSGEKIAWFADPDGNILSLTQFA